MDSKLGVDQCSHFRLVIKHKKYDTDKQAISSAERFLKQCNLPVHRFAFVAGTMFIVRAKLLRPLISLNIGLEQFELSTTSRETSLAHVLERFIGWSVVAQKYALRDEATSKNIQKIGKLLISLGKISRFFYRSKTTKKGNKIIKICKVPVFYLSIKRG